MPGQVEWRKVVTLWVATTQTKDIIIIFCSQERKIDTVCVCVCARVPPTPTQPPRGREGEKARTLLEPPDLLIFNLPHSVREISTTLSTGEAILKCSGSNFSFSFIWFKKKKKKTLLSGPVNEKEILIGR